MFYKFFFVLFSLIIYLYLWIIFKIYYKNNYEKKEIIIYLNQFKFFY